jgi:hypothetical protein
MAIALPIISLWSQRSSDALLSYTEALITLLVALSPALPLGLWAGYLWGRLLAAMLGVPRGARALEGLPPAV